MPCKCRRELASRRHKRSACIIWPGEHHLWGDSHRPWGGGRRGGEEEREHERSTGCRTTDGNWVKSEKRMNKIFGRGGDEKKWDGHHKRVQGNSTEAIRGNGGIISSCHIISTDLRTMHNLHRFNNTPHALILGQLPNWCHLVGLLYSVSSELWLMGRLMVFLPLERCRQLGGGPVHTSSLRLSIYSNSLHWPD